MNDLLIQTEENALEKAILVALDAGEYDCESSLAELSELAKTAGAEVVGTVVQKKDAPDSAYCIGRGKLAEVSELAEHLDTKLLIFDLELSPIQQRNIEKETGIRTIDRTALILDIFASRALSSEGRLQVELAQQRYLLPRLTGLGMQLSRQGGGIGTKGPGETKLESDKRHIRRRISVLSEELRELKKRRELTRERRRKDGFQVVAIVGYTNVGKSTLLNRLTGSEVLAENKLFATLDTTARALSLPDGKTVLLTDTVGLIRRLPHKLVEAFKSTLEEARDADLIVIVCDVGGEIYQLDVTQALLHELDCDAIPKIVVYNQCDRVERELLPSPKDGEYIVSAKTGEGLDALLSGIAKELDNGARRVSLLIPYGQAPELAKLRQDAKVFSEEYTENGIKLDILVDKRKLSLAEQFLVQKSSDTEKTPYPMKTNID